MIAFPLFYIPALQRESPAFTLDEDPSRHIAQVLRMKPGELVQLTDGKGNLATAVIRDAQKKKCVVEIRDIVTMPPFPRKTSIALSLLKNTGRFEWFLEKATEIGVTEMIPLLCDRTERSHFRQDRMQQILVSAMVQSQQCRLPLLRPPVSFEALVQSSTADRKLIAHCAEDKKTPLTGNLAGAHETLVLIGPEGDFSKKEIDLALAQGFLPVTLGATRLRSETAGIAAAALLCIGVYT